MLKRISFFFVLLVTSYACTSSEEPEAVVSDTFDRGQLLTNLADNLIEPAYDAFEAKMTVLNNATTVFTETPNTTNLEALRTAWLNAYKNWQHVEMFDIGKAEELQYKFYMNVYPLTVADVDANITTGVYDLNSVNNQDAQGFPALDYLLYGIGATDSDILEKYTTVENSDNYKAYLKAVVNQMQTLTTTVVSDFKLQKSIFVNNTQNTATSAFNKLINDFIFYYEKGLRANKFGIPAGVFSTTPLPEKVEGLFNKDSSKELALEALTAVTNFFEGASFTTGAKATSFNAYLQALDRSDIATSISNQLEKAIAQVTTLNDNFYTQITTDNTAMTKSYDELQKVVILLKVDMLQAFNISVDYVDADGD